MSSKPSTPVAQRRYGEHESSRIPISLSPIPFRRTYSMRLRTNCLLNETTLKQHNRNLLQTRNIVDRNHQQLKLNLSYNRRGSLSMDTKSDSNGIDSGGTDEVDRSPQSFKHLNGSLRRSSFNKNDRGMVSWRHLRHTRKLSLDFCQISLKFSFVARVGAAPRQCYVIRSAQQEEDFCLTQFIDFFHSQILKLELDIRTWLNYVVIDFFVCPSGGKTFSLINLVVDVEPERSSECPKVASNAANPEDTERRSLR